MAAALADALDAALEEHGAAGEPAEQATSGRVRVLIADDDEDMRQLVGGMIETDSALELVAVAADADEASRLAEENRPDVAVLDVSMPAGGGPAAASRIKERSPSTGVVALTALDTPDTMLEMLRAGAVSFLVKGTAPEEILRAIRNAARW